MNTQEKTDALFYAARTGRESLAQTLIESGVDVNAVNADKETPLHMTVFHGHSDKYLAVAKLLIDRGADLEALATLATGHKRTPLGYCTIRPDVTSSAMAELLINNGANVDNVDISITEHAQNEEALKIIQNAKNAKEEKAAQARETKAPTKTKPAPKNLELLIPVLNTLKGSLVTLADNLTVGG